MNYIVALTGGMCSGKTTISNSFKKIGIDVIDTDVIAKNIIENNLTILDAIKKRAGKKILNTDNSINRSLLRKHIFHHKNDRIWLENLLYPKIFEETKKKIKNINSTWGLWVVPLLIEKKLEKKAHRILLVDLSVKHQIKRIMNRDKISLQEAKHIISLQASRKERICISDDIIINKSTIAQVQKKIYYLNSFYSFLAIEHSTKTINIKKNYLTKFC